MNNVKRKTKTSQGTYHVEYIDIIANLEQLMGGCTHIAQLVNMAISIKLMIQIRPLLLASLCKKKSAAAFREKK